jgi:hypothetical protein
MNSLQQTPYEVVQRMLLELMFGMDTDAPITMHQIASALQRTDIRERFMNQNAEFMAEQKRQLREAILAQPVEPVPSQHIACLYEIWVNFPNFLLKPLLQLVVDAEPQPEDFDWGGYINFMKTDEAIPTHLSNGFSRAEREALEARVRAHGFSSLPGAVDITRFEDYLKRMNMFAGAIPFLGTAATDEQGRQYTLFAWYSSPRYAHQSGKLDFLWVSEVAYQGR